ncbi:MAG: CBS domain-containing protein [Planctomycetes bacterium]|nr:CBS domain-containing protein [Planctomycetota bacterium]
MILKRRAKVADFMTQTVETVSPDAMVAEAARKMRDFDCGALPVCDENRKLLGILTDRDIAVRAVAFEKDPKITRVGDIMTHRVVSCGPDANLREAEKLMQANQIRRLPVVDEATNGIVGILSLGKLARIESERVAGHVLKGVSEKTHHEPGYAESKAT